MDIERLKEHDLYVLRDIIGGLEEEQSIDPAIARQFEQVLDETIARQSVKSEDVAEAIWYYSHVAEITKGEESLAETSANLAITALQAYQLPSAIKWTGDNLREVINLTGWNESASSKWTWEEYEQVVKEKGLKIFTPDGAVIAAIGSWIVRDGNDCHVLQAYQPWVSMKDVTDLQAENEKLKKEINDLYFRIEYDDCIR